MSRYSYIILLLMIAATSPPATATTRHVGAGQPYASLSDAIAVTAPGDTVLLHHGEYAGGLSFDNLQGTSTRWIYIAAAPQATVVFTGGINAWHLKDAAYLQIKGISFQKQTGNGFNIDDGGSYNTPSHHIVFDSCTFSDINANGNNDLLKLSGVDFFEIKHCRFLNGAAGGSGIDMVGCHNGAIHHSRFQNLGSNSIQVKGGSSQVRIENNLFKNGGERALNLGGSTNLKLFRPNDARYEAAELKVAQNIFIGSDAPVAFVGCITTSVVNNIIYLPQKWVLQILQETVDTNRFYPCGNNSFTDNLIYRDSKVTSDCNVGANTNATSFSFANNQWYHIQNPTWAGPVLPVKEVDAVIGIRGSTMLLYIIYSIHIFTYYQ